MDAGKRTINEIFNGSRILEVPFFQRAYVWDEPQWERFLEDVETVSQTRTPYFMGSVILKQRMTTADEAVGDIRMVIDGQQRLTTISILAKVLCLMTDEEDGFVRRFQLDKKRGFKPVLQHSQNDEAAYNRIISLKQLKELPGEDCITRAYRYFRKNINPEKIDFDVICDRLVFVGIDLNYDEDEQQIFDTINSLGVRLTTAELLKNYFFSRKDVSEYKTYWHSTFEKDSETREYWDKEITAGRLKRTFADLFFFSYLQIKIQEGNLKVSTEDKIIFSKADKLFDSYKHFIKKYLNSDKKAIYKEIQEYAEIFRRSIDVSIIDGELPAHAGIERINALMFALDTTTLIPYVLFVERNVSDSCERDEIYAYLETYVMRRLITKQSTKNYNHLFADNLILNQVLSLEQLVKHISEQEDKTNRMPSDDEVQAAFHDKILTNKYAIGVLYLIESKIRDRSKHSTALLGINKYSLEHLMPKKWRNNWSLDGDEIAADKRDTTLLTLGNLAIITQSLNASIRDADWKIKKEGKGDKGGLIKFSEGIDTLHSYLLLDQWNEDTISVRANDLAEKALQTWGI